MTEMGGAGGGATAGTQVAGQIGGSPLGSAEHQGTSPGSLDTSSGLLSGLGGEAVHPMSYSGAEIMPKPNPTGTSMWLEESNQSGQTPTNWVSHPSGIGYRRSSPGVTTWTGSGSGSRSSTGPPIPGNAPTMDSGTSDGGPDQELNRLGNFIIGGNENPTSTQPVPTPRAEQLGMPMLPIGSPAAVNISSGLSPGDDAALNPPGPLGANLNNPMNVGGFTGYGLLQDLGLIPAGGGGGKASGSDPGGAAKSGRMGPSGSGTGGGGMTGPDGLVPGTGPVAPGPQPANPVPGSQVPPPSSPENLGDPLTLLSKGYVTGPAACTRCHAMNNFGFPELMDGQPSAWLYIDPVSNETLVRPGYAADYTKFRNDSITVYQGVSAAYTLISGVSAVQTVRMGLNAAATAAVSTGARQGGAASRRAGCASRPVRRGH